MQPAKIRPETVGLLLQGLALGVAVGVAFLVVALLLRDVADDQDAAADRKLLVECTTPPRLRTPPVYNAPPEDCYLRTRAETGAAVASINDVVILAAACAERPGVDDEAAIRECVLTGLGA